MNNNAWVIVSSSKINFMVKFFLENRMYVCSGILLIQCTNEDINQITEQKQ